MKVSEILNHVDLGFIALPVFQRGFVWNRTQVKRLFYSMYRSRPVGSLLVWPTQLGSVDVRGDVAPGHSPVRMLLDGQQRVTTLYGVIRGTPPPFFDGNSNAFHNLRFHLESEAFEFYQPIAMRNDPRWVDVTAVMKASDDEFGDLANDAAGENLDLWKHYNQRLGKLRRIRDRDLHEEVVSIEEHSVDEIVEIFNDVNSRGTKLTAGDLALARVCALWPEARDVMKAHLVGWAETGFDRFDLVWLLRCVNTVVTGRSSFDALSDRTRPELEAGLQHAVKAVDVLLNLLGDRLGLDHARVLTGHNALAVMARYVDQKSGNLTLREENLLLYWYLASAIRSRFSGSPETTMQRDLAAMEELDGGLDRLIEELHLSSGEIRVEPGHFDAARVNSRFFPLLYALTRIGGARDFCSGLELKQHLLGKQSSLQLHHLFPKSRLRDEHSVDEINALANFSFLTADCNGPTNIGNRLPEEYFPDCEARHPGVLESQWIPMDPGVWSIDSYRDFLALRRELLAEASNSVLMQLRTGAMSLTNLGAGGGVAASDEEEIELQDLNHWIEQRGLSAGILGHELAPRGNEFAPTVLDLAWPDGVQSELSEPVAVLLNEPERVVAEASSAGYRCFTSGEDFRQYIDSEILGETEDAA